MTKKAIVFTVFDRVEYFKKTMDAWRKVNNINNYEIYFKLEPSNQLQAMLDIINNFDDYRKSVSHFLINDSVLGNSLNTWEALDYLFKKYEFVILAEDDVVPSKDTLDYFEELEKKYRDEERVAVISANNRAGETNAEAVVRTMSFPGLIWGTWNKYWNSFFKETWDFDYSSGTEDKPQSGWDWNLTLRVMPNNSLYSIYPIVSRSQHIGVKGIHCDETIFHMTESSSFKEDNSWEVLQEV